MFSQTRTSTFSPNSKTAPHLNIQHRLANHDIVLAALQYPCLFYNIPCAHITTIEPESDLGLFARLQKLLLKATQHARRSARYMQIQLSYFGSSHTTRVLDRHANLRSRPPEHRIAALRLYVCAVAIVCGALGARSDVGLETSIETRICELGVRQAVAKRILRRDVPSGEIPVVDVDAFRERILREEAAGSVLNGRVEQGAVVGSFFGDSIGQAAGGGLPAVEDVDNGLSGFLAGQVSEDDGGDVGVVDEAVDNADAGIVDHNLRVFALASDIEDESV
jgi:hypothetical protein